MRPVFVIGLLSFAQVLTEWVWEYEDSADIEQQKRKHIINDVSEYEALFSEFGYSASQPHTRKDDRGRQEKGLNVG